MPGSCMKQHSGDLRQVVPYSECFWKEKCGQAHLNSLLENLISLELLEARRFVCCEYHAVLSNNNNFSLRGIDEIFHLNMDPWCRRQDSCAPGWFYHPEALLLHARA